MQEHNQIAQLLTCARGRHSCTLTAVNWTTGNRYTYRIAACTKNNPDHTKFFVEYLSGPNNETDYRYLGMFFAPAQSHPAKLIVTKASTVRPGAQCFIALEWLIQRVYTHAGTELPEGVEVLPSSHCGTCGRKLTDPDSIKLGIGPICRERIGA